MKAVAPQIGVKQQVFSRYREATRTELWLEELHQLFSSFKPFLGREFWPWLEQFYLPEDVYPMLNQASSGTLYLHAFIFTFTWRPVEERWSIHWRVDERKLAPNYRLDRPLATQILLKKADQVLIDPENHRYCQTYEADHFSYVW